jgi:hypothetical protein
VNGSLVLVKSLRASVAPSPDEETSGASEQSDPHHVSARHPGEAAWLAYVLRRVRGVCAALGDGRRLGSAKRAHLSRGSAWRRPWRPRERARDRSRSPCAKEDATETSRARSFEPCEGPKLLARLDRVAQRSARRETRVPPISLSSPGPEPCGERSFILGRKSVARLNAARCEL